MAKTVGLDLHVSHWQFLLAMLHLTSM